MKPLALLSSLSSGLYLFGSIYAMGSQRLPNVLFILVDDYGIKDVGIEGSAFYETPHIDNLARSGMRFTQGYANCQVWLKETGARIPQPNPQYRDDMAQQDREEAQALQLQLERTHAAFLNPGWQPNPTWWKSLVPDN